MTGMAMGTPAFMSPEQIEGDADIDIRSDIHALGATLFNALTGHPPFSGQTPFSITHKVMTQARPLLRTSDPHLSDYLQRVVLKAMARDREDRFQDPQELLDALRGRTSPGAPLPPSPSLPTQVIGGRAAISGAATLATSIDLGATATASTAMARAQAPVPRQRWIMPLAIALGCCALLLGGYLALRQQDPAPPPLPAAPSSGQGASAAPGTPTACAAPPSQTLAGPASLSSGTAPGMSSAQATSPGAAAGDPSTSPAPPAAGKGSADGPVASSPVEQADDHEQQLRHLEDRIGIDHVTAVRVLGLLEHLEKALQQLQQRSDLSRRERFLQVVQERVRTEQKAATFLMPAQLEAMRQVINAAVRRHAGGN